MRLGGATGTRRTTEVARGRRSRKRAAGAVAGGLACLALVIACGPTSSGDDGCGPAAAGGDLPAPSPACAMPGPSEPLWPVGEGQAVAAANAFTGQSDLVVTGQWREPVRVYVLQDATRTAVVDGTSGVVVEVFEVAPDILPGPDGETPAWSPKPGASPDGSGDGGRARAVATAARFLTAHGLTVPPASSAARADSPGANAWVVTWSEATGAAWFEVTVDAVTGDAVAFVDRRSGRTLLAVPRVDRDTAVRLAIARADGDQGRTDEQLTSVELRVEFPAGDQVNTWEVGLGVPRPDPSAGVSVWWFGTVIDVDASTGALTVVKK